MSNTQKDDDLIEYRLNALEGVTKAISEDINIIKDSVLRWDTKFSANPGFFMQCPIHAEKINNLTTQLNQHAVTINTHSTELESLRGYKVKIATIFAGIVLAMNVFSTPLSRWIFPEQSHASQTQSLPKPGASLSNTNGQTLVQR